MGSEQHRSEGGENEWTIRRQDEHQGQSCDFTIDFIFFYFLLSLLFYFPPWSSYLRLIIWADPVISLILLHPLQEKCHISMS